MFDFAAGHDVAWHEGHDHGHHHGHQHGSGAAPTEAERNTALLAYMVGHNRSHAEELHALAHELDGEAAELIHEAVEFFDRGNDKLDEALSILKGV